MTGILSLKEVHDLPERPTLSIMSFNHRIFTDKIFLSQELNMSRTQNALFSVLEKHRIY